MHIVLCLDDRNGMQFNSRRVSSDVVVCQRIAEQCAARLFVSSYSAKLFTDTSALVDDDYLNHAGSGDTCFVENLDFVADLAQVESITIYRWNRHYPSDLKFPEDALEGFTLAQQTDFAGKSHEKITEERYVK